MIDYDGNDDDSNVITKVRAETLQGRTVRIYQESTIVMASGKPEVNIVKGGFSFQGIMNV